MQPNNLYELCEQVCEAIEAQPLNYNQDHYAMSARILYGKAACGTAYCRAGWMMAVLENKPQSPGSCIGGRATALLESAGIPSYSIAWLFAAGTVEGERGSPEYIKNGVAGIRRFMTSWEHKLKTAQIKDGKVLVNDAA